MVNFNMRTFKLNVKLMWYDAIICGAVEFLRNDDAYYDGHVKR